MNHTSVAACASGIFALGRAFQVIQKGFAETLDAYNIMAPEPEGCEIKKLMHLLLANAQLACEQVDYINSHGTGMEKDDEVEALALFEIFGTKPYINTTKLLIGHTIGVCGAVAQ